MKYNTQEVAQLGPDYLGFIFYDKSPRNFEGFTIASLADTIKKVGVFVDAPIAFAKAKIKEYQLDIVQLHGAESAAYIKELHKTETVQIWKVFGIKDHFDFKKLMPYEGIVDAFLFDTKGKEKGGNGYTFDWSVLKEYPSETPVILSGGIGLDEVEKVKEILATDIPIYAIDVNSKLEKRAGEKNISIVKEFISEMGL